MFTKEFYKKATLVMMAIAGALSLTSHQVLAFCAATMAIALAATVGPIIPLFPQLHRGRPNGLKPDPRMLMIVFGSVLAVMAALVSAALDQQGVSFVLWLLAIPLAATPYVGQLKESLVDRVKLLVWRIGPPALVVCVDLLVLAYSKSLLAVTLSTLAVFCVSGIWVYLTTQCDLRFVLFSIDHKGGSAGSATQRYVGAPLSGSPAVPGSPSAYYDQVVELVLKHSVKDTEAFRQAAKALRRKFRTYRQAGIAARRAILALNDPHTWLLDSRETASDRRRMEQRGNVSWDIVGFTKDNPWFAVMHIESFSSAHVADEVRQALEEINAVSGIYAPAAIVLDLRGNPGGLAFEGLKVFDLFADEGQFLRAEGTENWRLWLEGHEARFEIDGKPLYMSLRVGNQTGNKPVLVLVDSNSASASEALACALKEHRGAKIVGERTWGKETGGQTFDVGFGTSLHVSVVRLLPEGYQPDGTGITPEYKAGMSFSQDYQRTSACHIANAMVWTDRITGRDAKLRDAAASVMHHYFDLLREVGTGSGGEPGGSAHDLPKGEALSELSKLLRSLELAGLHWSVQGNFECGIEVALANPQSGKAVAVCLPRMRTAAERSMRSYEQGGTLRAQFRAVDEELRMELCRSNLAELPRRQMEPGAYMKAAA